VSANVFRLRLMPDSIFSLILYARFVKELSPVLTEPVNMMKSTRSTTVEPVSPNP
jgi:hypothetical protein